MKTKKQLTRWTIIVCLMLVTLRAQAFYSPSSGRWLNRDSIGEKGGVHLYAFVSNGPVIHVDTLGDMAFEEVIAIKANIRNKFDKALWFPVAGRLVGYGLMFKWFRSGGDYDYKSMQDKRPDNETFDIGGGTQLKADQFGNYLAGYAAGYAFFESGDPNFVNGIMAFGTGYNIHEAYQSSNGLIGFFDNWVGARSMNYNGLLDGISDELFEPVY
jgi:hypothetical protein